MGHTHNDTDWYLFLPRLSKALYRGILECLIFLEEKLVVLVFATVSTTGQVNKAFMHFQVLCLSLTFWL